jgi:aspartyl-tRNA(Asn)/glutamyl-tRNA(Gln) amidotransferase subunit A
MSEHLEKLLDKKDMFNALIKKYPEKAREQAKNSKGRLAGKVFAIKSCINVEGCLTSCASKTLENYVAPYDATVIERIKKEGGIILSMANMDEFACGATGDSSYYGPTENPRASGRISGGSSSGSAAAVAAGYADMALGTDTGGSTRNPACYCGAVGFKPTYGTVSRYGACDMAMSLEQICPIANTVSDAALLLDVISGKDIKDATTLDLKGDFSKNLNTDINGKKLGYLREFDELIVDPGIREHIHTALEKLKDAGAKIIDVGLPSLDKAIPTYYLNVYVEFFSATRKYDGRRYGYKIEENCGEEVLRRIMLGSYISQAEWQGKFYRKGLQARSVIRNELMKALKDVDVLVGPVVPTLPRKLTEKTTDPKINYAYDIFTVPANLAGVPAGSVPAGDINGIPNGLQVIGRPLEDQKVLDVMAGFESITAR